MNKNQEILIEILALAIRGQKVEYLEMKDIDWEGVLNEAKVHGVAQYLYIALKEFNDDSEIWPQYINSLKAFAFSSVRGYLKREHEISKVLLDLNNAGIKVVALKGILIKSLYPYPELRVMGDIDILVSREELEKSKKILEQLGYFETKPEPKAIFMSHKTCQPIELHWTLLNQRKFMKSADSFQNKIWKSIKPVMVCGVEVYSLGTIDQLLHICMHMISHILDNGFGLRQLCDFVIYSEYVFDEIDWEIFISEAEKFGIDRFVYVLFEVANNLFGLTIPEPISLYKNEKKLIGALTNFIISGGDFGYRNAKWPCSQYIRSNLNRANLKEWLKLNAIIKWMPTLLKELFFYNYTKILGDKKKARLINGLGLGHLES